ncbi:hypothetical protein LIPSTDRAFT_190 [Lipomyces starkeyi NRRL Y-11557]|uniref:Uncharacterized protein n=1 Tax=Lipomyces starkeyi NRRL Y-11557 TaxID=675824 RepID=A0A1E3QEV6_LIPST|nr:hypothetical protein LIPSTDRAFT_5025 [Lipomyces starkeyi NRRL Y-11557]ODQ76245.1 hypothetical protein LIPSTDRAFT_190 [Lipomyces starkeyi NRRL Y-11557]
MVPSMQMARVVRVILEPGKNRQGYWKSPQMCEQLEHAIQVFEKLHPDCLALFCFEQSRNHQAVADDARTIDKFNLNDHPPKSSTGLGKGFYSAAAGNTIEQAILYPDDYPNG